MPRSKSDSTATNSPSLPSSAVSQLRAFFARQAVLNPSGAGSSRYIDLTPYPGLPSPIVASAWGFQLRLTSPTDPRLQQFVNKFRVPTRIVYRRELPKNGVGKVLKRELRRELAVP